MPTRTTQMTREDALKIDHDVYIDSKMYEDAYTVLGLTTHFVYGLRQGLPEACAEAENIRAKLKREADALIECVQVKAKIQTAEEGHAALDPIAAEAT